MMSNDLSSKLLDERLILVISISISNIISNISETSLPGGIWVGTRNASICSYVLRVASEY